jgi:hypothetical protein
MCWCDPSKRIIWCDNCHTVRPDLVTEMEQKEQGRVAFEDLRFSDEEIELFKNSHELSVMSLKVWQDAEKKGMREFTNKLYEVAKRDHHITPDAVLAIAAEEGLWETLKENLSEMALAAIICHQQGALRKEINMRVSGGRIIVMPGA